MRRDYLIVCAGLAIGAFGGLGVKSLAAADKGPDDCPNTNCDGPYLCNYSAGLKCALTGTSCTVRACQP
jgi:hypothetical protein